jgi:hypothetical protein
MRGSPLYKFLQYFYGSARIDFQSDALMSSQMNCTLVLRCSTKALRSLLNVGQRARGFLYARRGALGWGVIELHKRQALESANHWPFIHGRGKRNEPMFDAQLVHKPLLPFVQNLLWKLVEMAKNPDEIRALRECKTNVSWPDWSKNPHHATQEFFDPHAETCLGPITNTAEAPQRARHYCTSSEALTN